MKAVVIESPLAGSHGHECKCVECAGEVERNLAYLDAAILDCLRRCETPYASHRMLTSALADADHTEREMGIQAGFRMAEAIYLAGGKRVVYCDFGVSGGMERGIQHSNLIDMEVVYRSLPEWKGFKR